MAKQKVKTALGGLLKDLDKVAPTATAMAENDLGQEKRSRDLIGVLGGKTESEVIREVETKRCRLWERHNRLYDLLTLEDCQDLVDSIRAEGQIEPVVARKLRDDPEYDFEIIAGARRLWACVYLQRPIRLTIKDMDDRRAFLFSDASNRYSDISDYERAIEYRDALERYFGGNQSEFAASVGRSIATISRYKALWELDSAIIAAYPDPRTVTAKTAAKLRAAMANDDRKTEAMLAKAKELNSKKGEGIPTEASAVTQLLIAATAQPVKRDLEKRTYKDAAGRQVIMEAQKATNGAVVIRIPKGQKASREELSKAFNSALDDLFTVKTVDSKEK